MHPENLLAWIRQRPIAIETRNQLHGHGTAHGIRVYGYSPTCSMVGLRGRGQTASGEVFDMVSD